MYLLSSVGGSGNRQPHQHFYMDQIHEHYPGALKIRSLAERIVRNLNDHDLSLSKTIWATSLCADEVNNGFNIFSALFAGSGPFRLGGMAGLPFIGKTGMQAFASHVPTHGGAFIIYGPHIGITSDGVVGKIYREEQEDYSNCCGSITAGVHTVNAGIKPPEVDRLDPQQNRVAQILYSKKREFLDASDPLKAATEVIYQRTHRRIREMVDLLKEDFEGSRVYTMGGVVINTDWDKEDCFQIRDTHFYDFRTQKDNPKAP